jgi:hypothetical protein
MKMTQSNMRGIGNWLENICISSNTVFGKTFWQPSQGTLGGIGVIFVGFLKRNKKLVKLTYWIPKDL